MKRIVLTEEELNEQKVILKPLFGIQPETYIKYVYALLTAALLFAFLILPGLLKNGTYYRFSSSPQGASVYVDGERLGATPGTYFVRKGERSISLQTPFHEADTATVDVKGRVIGSLIFKRKREYSAEPVFTSGREDLKEFHQIAASWFQSDEGYSSQPLPPIMTSFTKAFYRSIDKNTELTDKDFRGFHLSLLRTISQSQSYREWQESTALYLTRGKVLNPASFLRAVAEGSRFLADNPEVLSIAGQYQTIPGITPSGATWTPVFGPVEVNVSYQPLKDDPLQFRPVGTITQGNGLYDVFAADREITKGWYSLFLEENPAWTLPSLEDLTSRGLADDSYLSDWDGAVLSGKSQEPVRFISRYAADEFCRWRGNKYFGNSDMTVRLPDEWEWEDLARKNGLKNSDRPSQKNLGPLEAGSFLSGSLKLYDMEGNLWEWCRGSYGTNDQVLKESDEIMTTALPFPDSPVRGGSWANSAGQVDSGTRGSQPSQWCTAYVGFRPLLVVKRK